MGEKYVTGAERDRRGVRRALIGLTALLGGLYLCGWLFLGGSVPDGTRVADVEIGGLSPDDAEHRLQSALADRVEQPIVLTWQGQRFEIDPKRAGLRLDVEATVEEAGGGRSWNPLRMLETLLSPGDVAPVVEVNEQALDVALARVARQIEMPPAEPRITFDAAGRREVSYPKSGHTVDHEAVADDVVAAYLRSEEPILLKIAAIPPTAGVGDLTQALRTLVDPVTSGPIRLELPNRTVQLTVPEFAPALTLRGQDGALRPSFNVERLRQTMASLRERVGIKPRNARVVLRNGRPAVVPSKPGRSLDPVVVADAIAPVLIKTGPARTARVRLSTWGAGFSTDDARALGIRQVVSSFGTPYPHAGYRNVNMRRATTRINGTVLWPGETFSFNDTVGPRTRSNGFVKGYVRQGRTITQEFGGGVSQVATTVFNAAFLAGMENIVRKPYSSFVERYPVGRDAAVGDNVDLRFTNTTPYGVLIQTWIEPSKPHRRGKVQVRIWSTKHWHIAVSQSKRRHVRPPDRKVDRTQPCRAHRGQPGFVIEVFRDFRRHGTQRLHHRESMRASYRATDTVVCRVPRDRGDRRRG